MSGGTCQCSRPKTPVRRRIKVPSGRAHDYLYDSAYLVSGARDYARTQFKAAMISAQVILQPVYKTMFSELPRRFPRVNVVYHPNCRLPEHMYTTYQQYLSKRSESQNIPTPDFIGKARFKYTAKPKPLVQLNTVMPDFHPPTPQLQQINCKPINRGTQSMYRESSAQTTPWQPDGKAADNCKTTPEVLFLDKLEWGPGKPYRNGDLPADFHTTEIINKMRHARIWYDVVDRGQYPRWMKKREAIITDIEDKDWIFREAEIDELQDIRVTLLHKLQNEQRDHQTSKTSMKLAKRWANNKKEMERKINMIRRSRDRELRKLEAIHSGGGRLEAVQRSKAARGMGSYAVAAADPTSDIYAPVARHGYQARGRHAVITYDPSLLLLEDHKAFEELPAWVESCGKNLTKTCSGHHLPHNPKKLCERETKWSEEFLAILHNDLKKARLGAAEMSAGPLRVLKPRRLFDTPRPSTPEVDAVTDTDEAYHQSSLLLQRIIRGRAVQCLMYEGRTRAAELTEELKTTHGLQKEDKIRIAKEEARARDYKAIHTETEKKEDAITALVDELCGGAVSAALDFLEKELRRLKEERKQHAFVMIALREKQMREAAEAGRRQKEEHRRREHDEMFKQVLGVTQDTVDSYLESIIAEGVAMNAEEEAVRRALLQADQIDESHQNTESLSTAEQNEMIAELVQQFLLPAAHKQASKHRIEEFQRAKLEAARRTIFGLLDDAEIKEPVCIYCGTPLGEICRCTKCPTIVEPQETKYRHDPRWRHTRRRPVPKVLSPGEKFPPSHEFRCMLDTLIDEVVVESRRAAAEREELRLEYYDEIKERVEKQLEAKSIVQEALDIATGAKMLPVRVSNYRHLSRYIRKDALERTEPVPKPLCSKELPSAIRYKAEVQAALEDGTCRCKDEEKPKVMFGMSRVVIVDPEVKIGDRPMLPSEVRALEELRRCKCDESDSASTKSSTSTEVTTTAGWSFEDEGTIGTKSYGPPPTKVEEEERDQTHSDMT